jgi:hypothetical protein
MGFSDIAFANVCQVTPGACCVVVTTNEELFVGIIAVRGMVLQSRFGRKDEEEEFDKDKKRGEKRGLGRKEGVESEDEERPQLMETEVAMSGWRV